MQKKSIIFIFFLLIGFIPAFGGSVKIYESAPRGQQGISVGDRFYITIEVNDLDGKPEIPANVGGAKVLYFDHTGQMSSMTSVNGRVTQSTKNTWTVTLRANSEGTYTFGPVSVNGVKSNQISYTIGKAAPKTQASGTSGVPNTSGADDDTDKPKFIGKGDGNLFMKASITESTVYEQQALVYTVKLYTTYDAIKFIGATAAPKFDGFVVEESKAVSNSLDYETLNGKTYATAVIARYIIFPQMTGQLKVIGNTYTVSVDQREYYHDPFWGSMAVSKPLQLNVTPNDLTVNVKPLPSPKPADFSGGVGQFTIASQLKSSDFKTNQAGSIEYIITGTGNIKYVQMPDLATIYPSEIEVYSPKTEVKDAVGASNVSGSSTFDYSFMPLEEGEFNIPAINLVYFNPQTGKYETSISKSYTIQVGKGKASAKSQTNSRLKFDPNLEPVNLKSLKKEHKPIIYGFPYWLFFIIPFLALVGSIVAYQRYMNMHADMAALNSRRANKLAAKRLRKAAVAMKKGNTEEFYDEMLTAIWGYLGDKLKMPTSELMRDNIRAVLTEKEIPQSNIDSVVELLDNCEFAKYAPLAASSGMKETYQTAVDVINNLEKSFKKTKGNNMKNIGGAMIIALLISLFPGILSARNVATLDEAEKAYEAGEYSKAATIYKEIADSVGVSAELYANMGNAYAKAGDYGHAFLYYERSLYLNPSDKEVRNNRAYIVSKIEDGNKANAKGKKISVTPDEPSFFSKVGEYIKHSHTSNTWAIWGGICFILLCGCIALYFFRREVIVRKIGFFGGFGFAALTIIFLWFAFASARACMEHNQGVIMGYKVVLLSEPFTTAKSSSIPLERGTRLDVIEVETDKDEKPEWYKVRLNSDIIGWIPASEFEVI